MSKFNVTTAKLREGANQLSEMNQNFISAVSELESLKATLDSMWDGQANSAFNNAMARDVEQMRGFSTAISTYIATLNEIAARYDLAEARNTDTATRRTYH